MPSLFLCGLEISIPWRLEQPLAVHQTSRRRLLHKTFLQRHQLAQVVGVVIRYEHRFAEQRLAAPPLERLIQVTLSILHERLHLRHVVAKGFDRLRPRVRRRRLFLRGPVVCRPVERFIPGVAGKVQDIPLTDPQMLQDLPRRVRGALRPDAA